MNAQTKVFLRMCKRKFYEQTEKLTQRSKLQSERTLSSRFAILSFEFFACAISGEKNNSLLPTGNGENKIFAA